MNKLKTLITCANSGIGKEISEKYAKEKHDLVLQVKMELNLTFRLVDGTSYGILLLLSNMLQCYNGPILGDTPVLIYLQ